VTGALDGLLVLDLATFVAAPFCCTLLADFGAEVIKVEQPGRGDDLRRLGRQAADGVSFMWLVNSVEDIFADPHMRARENIVQVDGPSGGRLSMPGVVPKLSRTPGRVTAPGPVAVGAHNEEIYCGRLGLTRDGLAALARKGIV
jgi:crotonobetainyl-CoA:carnitine CoA-transferase CaiB-like acyl-CoA transferase